MKQNESTELLKELLREAISGLDVSSGPDLKKLEALLKTSLEYLRIISGEGRILDMKEDLSVQDLINRVAELLEYQLRIRSMNISYSLPEEELFIKGDCQNFLRALLYIFMEIIKLHDKGEYPKTIFLSVIKNDDSAELSIQLSTKDRIKASIGYTKSLIEQSGGSLITQYSEDSITLKINIPLRDANAKQNGTLKVLVVDDDPMIRELLSDFLQMLGEECIVCESQKKALEIIKNSCPDIVLVDYNMPEMNGMEFINRASQFIDRKRLCLLTGELASTILNRFREDERVYVIEKPLTISKLRNFLNSVRESICSM